MPSFLLGVWTLGKVQLQGIYAMLPYNVLFAVITLCNAIESHPPLTVGYSATSLGHLFISSLQRLLCRVLPKMLSAVGPSGADVNTLDVL